MALTRFLRQEDGTGSVLPMLMLIGVLLAGGFAIDTSNLWYHGEVLRATADAAAHAGVVGLARGDDAEDAAAKAERAIGLNMDPATFAPAIGKPRSDLVQVWHYDPDGDVLSGEGPDNAVSVQLRRGAEDANPVPMFVMKIFGFRDWTATTTAVAALTPTTLCSNAAGLFARDGLRMDGQSEVGTGYCLHSQSTVTLGGHNRYEAGSSVSLPDLAKCEGNCGGKDIQGGKVAREANLISLPAGAAIMGLAEEMLAPALAGSAKESFFASRPISEDLEPLAELELETGQLHTGGVVALAAADFEILREVPRGLVYAVTCKPLTLEPPVLTIRGGMNGPVVSDIAIVTNCALKFEDDVEVTGALFISTYQGDLPAVTAEPYAVLGDPAATCDLAAMTQVMAFGDMALPAGLLISNLAMVVEGNVTLLAGEGGAPAQHHGFSLHAGGEVRVEGHHSFAACDGENVASLPALQVIRHVMPHVDPMPKTPMMKPHKLPGKAPQRLESTPPLPMSRVPPQVVSEVEIEMDEVGL
jgi:hypothetical protein